MSEPIRADSPILDPARLDNLQRAGVLDTPAEPSFDRVTSLVGRLIDVPVALASFVDRDRQFFKSRLGEIAEPWLSARQTPLSHSICRHVVERGRPLIIEDVGSDPLTKNSRARTELGVMAYAGMPLRSPDGSVLGSLCAIDTSPRRWTDDELSSLALLVEAANTEIALRLAGTRQREALVKLEEANLRVDIAGRARSVFLASISHEFRTSLGAVIGYSELLESASSVAECREYGTAVRTAATTLRAVVESILHQAEDGSEVERAAGAVLASR